MKFTDEATIFVEAGKGGDGSRSFRREKYIPFGGPDGGDGGAGGDVFLIACASINTLVDFRYIRRIKAEHGDSGHGKQCYGKGGKDQTIRVPVGTMVFDNETDELLGDLVHDGQKLIVARGGQGGLGNIHFKSPTNRAPKIATPGKPGEARQLRLELKLLADVGLLGLPNAGKSTFIRAISAAKPKVADYPFTTLHPQLGTVRLSKEQSFVVADIPGIIEGAHTGQGLGLQFLRHLSRTKLLLHCVDCSPYADMAPNAAIDLVFQEISAYAESLAKTPRWLLLTKVDTLDASQLDVITQAITEQYKEPVFAVSSIAQQGIKPLIEAVWHHLQAVTEKNESVEGEAETLTVE